MPPHRRNVGLVFQNYALFPHMDVRRNIEFGQRMRAIERSERERRVNDALELVRLGHLAERAPGQLSGGQQQRVALARALAIQPDVLLLDEPFGALDKQLRDHMRVELRALQKSLGISTVFVTHDQDEALSMSDRIVVMSEGRIEQIGTPNQIYEQPHSKFVAQFLGHSNILDADIVARGDNEAVLDAAGLRLTVAAERIEAAAMTTVLIRPERIRFAVSKDANKPNAVAGRIQNIVYLGSLIHYDVEIGNGRNILIIQQNDGDVAEAETAIGSSVSVTIPNDAVRLIPAQ